MKVDVYFNLHRKLFSIRACEGPNKGRVIAHRETVTLLSPEFKVSQAGRARVLREGRKNVHATVRGQWLRGGNFGCSETVEKRIQERGVEITYNPYKGPSFTYKQTGSEYVGSTDAVLLACVDHPEVFVC